MSRSQSEVFEERLSLSLSLPPSPSCFYAKNLIRPSTLSLKALGSDLNSRRHESVV